MASNSLFVVIAIVAIFLPSMALAKLFVVGDEMGWTIGFDYQGWANGKEFHVGDQLVFVYPVGVHNVYKVNGTGFQECIIPSGGGALTSGSDMITLATPGNKWYICGVGQHCEVGGQKLFITVQPETISPSMPPMAPVMPPTLSKDVNAWSPVAISPSMPPMAPVMPPTWTKIDYNAWSPVSPSMLPMAPVMPPMAPVMPPTWSEDVNAWSPAAISPSMPPMSPVTPPTMTKIDYNAWSPVSPSMLPMAPVMPPSMPPTLPVMPPTWSEDNSAWSPAPAPSPTTWY